MKIPDPIYDQYYFSSPRNQEAILRVVENLLAKQKKAYGGCDKCFGKGYATNIDFMSGRGIHYQAPYYLPCDCNRGEQIREMMSEQKKEFLMSENSEWHKDELRKEIKKELLDLVAKEIEKKYDIDYNMQDEPFRSNNLYNEALDDVLTIINKLRV